MTKNKNKRLAVCLNDYSDNSVLINEAVDTASRENCSWFVIYIENDARVLDPISKQRLERSFDLAKELGAEVIRMPSNDIADGIITAAELHNITHVIIGKTSKSEILRVFFPSIATKLLTLKFHEVKN